MYEGADFQLSCLWRSYTAPPTRAHTALDLIKWSKPFFFFCDNKL